MKYLIILIFALVFIQPVFSDYKNWTIMVYMDGDNNLEEDAITDFNEMEQGFVDGSDLNVVVQLDRADAAAAGYYDDTSNGDWTDTRRYLIKHDGITTENTIRSTLLTDLGEVNMGDRHSVENLIDYCATYYPAKHYMLIFWNHGGGWLDYFDENEGDVPRAMTQRNKIVKSVCIDDTDRDDLNMTELYYIMEYFKERTGKKLSILGFDACLMQMLEVEYQVQPFVDYMVGSELTEPAYGWPYKPIISFACKNEYFSELDLANEIAKQYYISYAGENTSATQSVVDLSRLPETISLLNRTINTLMNNYSRELVETCVESSQHFQNDNYGGLLHNYIDLYSFCQNLYLSYNMLLIPEVYQNAMNLYEQISDDIMTGEVSSSNQMTSYSARHLIGVYIYKDAKRQNLVVPNSITHFLPKDLSIYNWQTTPQVSCNIDIDNGISKAVSIRAKGNNSSLYFKNSSGCGYSFDLIPITSHELASSTSNYLKLNGSVEITIKGEALIKKAVCSNYTESANPPTVYDPNVDYARGISIYFPQRASGNSNEIEINNYRHMRLCRDSLWDEFLIAFLNEDAKRKFLGYSYLQEKIEDIDKTENKEKKEMLKSALKIELEQNIEAGLYDNVEKFSKRFGNSYEIRNIMPEINSKLRNIYEIKSKTGGLE